MTKHSRLALAPLTTKLLRFMSFFYRKVAYLLFSQHMLFERAGGIGVGGMKIDLVGLVGEGNQTKIWIGWG